MERAGERRNPFTHTDPDEAMRVIESLSGTEPDAWAQAWATAGAAHARAAETAPNEAVERRETELAYGFFRVARYPASTTPAKRELYRRSQDWYLRLAKWFDPPLERMRIPFRGRSGEGDAIVADLRVPGERGRRVVGPSEGRQSERAGRSTGRERDSAQHRPSVVVLWGGIDSFKEERRPEPYLERGLATLAMDMPGVGDAPLMGSEDAERLWDPVFDWLAAREDVDGRRVGVVGGSTGGYWAAKLAHTHRERLAAAVCHGGCAHHAFTAEWIAKSADGEYPFELAETLAAAFGLRTAEEWIAYAPRLSLLTQGLLDRSCAQLLLVNGARDTVFPIADMHLLLEHGSPKSARFFDAGHMGGDAAVTVIADWVAEKLAY